MIEMKTNIFSRGALLAGSFILFLSLIQLPAQAESMATILAGYRAGNFRKAANGATHLLKKEPNNPALRWLRGTSLYALGEKDTALADLGFIELAWFNPGKTIYNWQTMSPLLPNLPAGHKPSRDDYKPLIAYACYEKAELLFAEERFTDAFTSFDRAMALQPAVQEYREGRAQAMMRQGRFEAAALEFQQMARDPNSRRRDFLYAMAGQAWQKTGDYKSSLPLFDSAMVFRDSVPDYYFMRGFSRLEARQPFAAVADFQYFVSVYPENLDGLYQLGRAQHASGDYDGAILTWRRLQRLNGGYMDTWYQLGSSLGAAGDWAQAIIAYDKAIAASGDQPIYYYNRAVAKKMLNRPKEEICLDLRKAANLGNPAAQRLVVDYGCGY